MNSWRRQTEQRSPKRTTSRVLSFNNPAVAYLSTDGGSSSSELRVIAYMDEGSRKFLKRAENVAIQELLRTAIKVLRPTDEERGKKTVLISIIQQGE